MISTEAVPHTGAAETARLFNSALGAAALSAANELGLLERLRDEPAVGVASFCAEHDLHEESVVSICRALAAVDVLELTPDGQVRPGRLFATAYREKGYFLWLVRGYGHMLEHLADHCRLTNRPADPNDRTFVRRRGKYIALAGHDYGARFVDGHVEAIVNERPFRVAADLGCGAAGRLIDLVGERDAVRGVGIEIDEDAVRLARANVAAAGLADRISIVHADATALDRRPEFDRVDLLCSFFMGHDLWPRPRCRRVLEGLPIVFPSLERFLLCDTHREHHGDVRETPIFVLAFELTHAVMGQRIPTATEWLELFDEVGLRCAGAHRIGIPSSTIFDLRIRC
jgi:hypothetical protein